MPASAGYLLLHGRHSDHSMFDWLPAPLHSYLLHSDWTDSSVLLSLNHMDDAKCLAHFRGDWWDVAPILPYVNTAEIT